VAIKCGIVGLPNVGKSTLFNTLTHSGVQTDDALFVTLDPILRRVSMAEGFSFLLSDTVGFIRRLPEQLVTAFKATLEELDEADLLLHMIDASHPQVMEQKEAVDTILRDLGLSTKPIVEVFNKVDRLMNEIGQSFTASKAMVPRVAVSALTGYGLDRLLQTVRESLAHAASQARAYDWAPYPAVHA